MNPCSVEGCHRTSSRGSICSMHRMRISRAKKRFTITCAHCGQDAQVGSRPDQVYCTAVCRQAATVARRERSGLLAQQAVCSVDDCDRMPRRRMAMCGMHYQRQRRSEKKYLITCAYCGQDAKADRPEQRYCSVACGGQAASKARSEQLRLARAARTLPVIYTGPPYVRPQRTVPHTRGRLTWRTGQCRICSTWFTHWNLDVTCSTACLLELQRERKSMAKHKRRAVKKECLRR